MNLYLKAAIITFIIFLFGLFLVQQMDVMRFNDLNSKIDSEIINLNETKLLFLFSDVFNQDNSELCAVLKKRIDLEAKKTYSLVKELDESKKNSLLLNYDLLKKKYFLKNAELFLYLKQTEKNCVDFKLKPLLYFYPDSKECPDCFVQGKILDKIRDACNVRVFAFPTDLNIEIISLLKTKYSVTKTPSIVMNGVLFTGLQSEEKIKKELNC